ncbi:sulfotransferase family protein [Microbispora rosea subsp. aerata]|nr:sulfotransferase [Microbispora rosea]GGO08323.1 sulfotransferase family protein [Microbispora rosea subsp. aerata]GIH55431.1 sulfotransferase family protein [Microbispora rosea subsp. aerata]GLJ84628.1 sulfotransferase family protein [Microbispora rosea subsp. aerata]
MADTQPVIFVGGLGRSGSTLLERLLGEVPGVVPLGEVVHLWDRGVRADEPCGCGQRFSQCPFWTKVGIRAFGQWRQSQAGWLPGLRARVDRTRRVPVLALGLASREAELAEYVRSYSRIYAAAAEVADAQVVLDSSKHASLAYCLSAIMDVRVVQVVRDPRAVAASWRRRVRRPEDGRPMTRWTPARTAVHWLAQNLAFEVLRRKGVEVVRVRHEDLVRDPRGTLGRLVTRLGLPDGGLPFLDGHRALLGVAHTVSGNPMRFSVGTVEIRDRPGPLRRSQRWLVTAMTLPLLLWYGYRLAYRPGARR